MIEWMIIGGGIHGTFLSHVLRRRLYTDTGQIVVVDPHRVPLAQWDRRVQNCGMKYLRSPGAHCLDSDYSSLFSFERSQATATMAWTPQPYRDPNRRPHLSLFRAHVAHVIERDSLAGLRVRASVTRIERSASGWTATLDSGGGERQTITVGKVIIALGRGNQLYHPPWAQGMPHLLDVTFDADRFVESGAGRRCAVIGSGLTGAQFSLRLAAAGAAVTLVGTEGITVHQYDSDPCYLGPSCGERFARAGYGERIEAINRAMHTGSVPGDVGELLQARLSSKERVGRVRLVTGTVVAARGGPTNELMLETDRGFAIASDAVVLATGFGSDRPGGELVSAIVRDYGLPVAKNGLPILAASLEWDRGLYVTGALAQLEIGPAAGNIAGAHAAGKRLVAASRFALSEPALRRVQLSGWSGSVHNRGAMER